MANDRLRSAIRAAGLTFEQVGEQIEVDPKTVERWISKGRLPHRANRQRLALALGVDEAALWPEVMPKIEPIGADHELVRIYPSRGSIPTETWTSLIDKSQNQIDILAFAASFLHDGVPAFVDRLRDRAQAGAKVRLAFGDPDAPAVVVRGLEEGIGESLSERCRLTWKYLAPLRGIEGVETRRHDSTLYQSIFRFDENLLVNQHTFGSAASKSPVLLLRIQEGGPLTSAFCEAFETVWSAGFCSDVSQ